MIKVRVPATSANVGCGYDCLGLALRLYTTFTFEEVEFGLQFEGCDSAYANEDNLIYTSFLKTLVFLNEKVNGLKITITSDVPISRGLGSSAICVVGGIYGAYALTNTPINKEDILHIATQIEGHPDNVAPAIYGGLRASCMVDQKVYSVAYDIDKRFLFQALIPNFETLTSEARKAIPLKVTHKDAIFSLSRLSVVLKAFETYDLEAIKNCMADALHEPYRIPLIHEYEQVKAICQKNDSVSLLVSGSGSTLLNIIEKAENEKPIKTELNQLKHQWLSILLQIDDEGAKLC